MADTKVCPGCNGVIRGSRKVPLETAIANHQPTCPARK